jgi:hypothetical protein
MQKDGGFEPRGEVACSICDLATKDLTIN